MNIPALLQEEEEKIEELKTSNISWGINSDTADFIKKVLSVYTPSITTIYLSLSARYLAKSTFFMKSPLLVLQGISEKCTGAFKFGCSVIF